MGFFQTKPQLKRVGFNDLDDKMVQLLSELIVDFNWHLEELKLVMINGDTDQALLIVKDFMDLDSSPEDERVTATVVMNMPMGLIAQPINPHVLSLSTDFRYDLKAIKVEELALNIRSQKYSLPEFGKEMGQLKVLIITGNNDYPTKLRNLSSIGCLSGLKSIRFEHVSVSSLQPVFALKNLTELSFVMCEIGDALMSCYTTDQSPHMLPNLASLEFDMCYDLKELPSELCNLVRLEELSVTNCHELDVLPEGLGGLSNLEVLNLHCCTKLQGLPESIGGLSNLSSIDISDCLSISALPEEIGELCGLRVLKMKGCGGLQELLMSIGKLWQLEEVICDEETSYLWMDFESDLPNLKINVVEDDILESFMKIVQ